MNPNELKMKKWYLIQFKDDVLICRLEKSPDRTYCQGRKVDYHLYSCYSFQKKGQMKVQLIKGLDYDYHSLNLVDELKITSPNYIRKYYPELFI